MVDRYGKWHVKNQSEIKILSWQVKNHNDHKAKQVNPQDRKYVQGNTHGVINGTCATEKVS